MEFIREWTERESSHDESWSRCVRYVKACYLWRLKLCCEIMTELTFFCWQFWNYFFPEGKQARAYDGQTPQNEIFTLCYICHNCRDSDCLKKWQLWPAAPEFLAGSSLYTGFSTGFGDKWKAHGRDDNDRIMRKLPEAKSGEMENILLVYF